MGVEIDIRAGESYAFAVSPELEDPEGTRTKVRIAFRWLPRVGRWACVVTDPSTKVPIGIEQHVTDGGILLLDVRLPGVPPGTFVFRGEDPYGRDDLGETIRLYYLTAAEVSA